MSRSLADQEDVQRRLLQLSLTTGYEILQKQGQRVYGPPPGMAHSRPEIGAQVYVSKIPRNCYEDELVPVFSSVGKIYELRLMLEFSGATRTYCYVSYCRKEDADEAVRRLHDYEVRPGCFLAVKKSVDNRKLVIKPSPALAASVTEEDVREELRQQLEGIVGVRFISSRWMEVEFESHKMAALARGIIVPGSLTIFQTTQISQVDWQDPEIEGYVTKSEDNRKLHVKNLPREMSDRDIRNFFNGLSSGQHVESVVRRSSGVILTFLSPEAAQTAMLKGAGLAVEGERLEVSWWLDRLNCATLQPWATETRKMLEGENLMEDTGEASDDASGETEGGRSQAREAAE